MINKKIDNEIINIKKKLNQIDEEIDAKKNRLKQIDDMQQNIVEIDKGFERVVEILSKSIKGENTDLMFQNIRDVGKKFYRNASSSLDEETLEIRMDVNQLYRDKDDIIKEDKKNRGAYNADSGDKEG